MTNVSAPKTPTALRTDLLLLTFLIVLDVVARLLPHAPNFTPVAASTLFAAGSDSARLKNRRRDRRPQPAVKQGRTSSQIR
jgi:hypothetical protein